MRDLLRDHIVELANEHDVRVWVCENCEGDPWGEAIDSHGTQGVYLSQPPNHSREAYLVALHELGHHIGTHSWSDLKLDQEASAWLWAIHQTGLYMTPSDWDVIRSSLESYAQDRRFKQTELFTDLLNDVRSRARV